MMTLEMSDANSAWVMCPKCNVPCKGSGGLTRHTCASAVDPLQRRLARGVLANMVAAAQGVDVANINFDGPVYSYHGGNRQGLSHLQAY